MGQKSKADYGTSTTNNYIKPISMFLVKTFGIVI